MALTKLFLENALAIQPAQEPLLLRVARCIPVLSSRYIGKCTVCVLKCSGQTDAAADKQTAPFRKTQGQVNSFRP